MSAGLMDRAEEKLRSLLGSTRYRAGRAREARLGLRAAARLARGARFLARAAGREAARTARRWRRTTAASSAKRRWRRAISPRARTQLAAARVHDAGRARAPACSRRASPRPRAMTDKALELYAAALGGSRTHARPRSLQEAHAALGARSARARRAACARSTAPQTTRPRRPSRARFRCEECGVASVTWHWRCPSCRNWDSLRSTNNRGV